MKNIFADKWRADFPYTSRSLEMFDNFHFTHKLCLQALMWTQTIKRRRGPAPGHMGLGCLLNLIMHIRERTMKARREIRENDELTLMGSTWIYRWVKYVQLFRYFFAPLLQSHCLKILFAEVINNPLLLLFFQYLNFLNI